MNVPEEIWKDIPEYEGFYQASTFGRIKTIERLDSSGRKRKEIIRKLYTNDKGYYKVALQRKSYKGFGVHQLVAKTFLLNPENKKFVNHKNGIKGDNRVINLEWVTHEENMKHAAINGFMKKKGKSNRLLTDFQVSFIKNEFNKGVSINMISKILNTHRLSIRNIVYGKSYQAI